MSLCLCVCVCVCVRFLSASCLSGLSAIQPAATCKASMTWSRRFLSSTSLSTSVSAVSPSLPPFSLSFKKLNNLLCDMLLMWGSVVSFCCPFTARPALHGGTFVAGKTQGLLAGSSPRVTGNQPWDPRDGILFSQLSDQWTPPTTLRPPFLSLFFHLSVHLSFLDTSICV